MHTTGLSGLYGSSYTSRTSSIYSGRLSCLGMENAEYICKETARPNDYIPCPGECLKIKAILEYVSTRFRKTPKEKTEKELEELIDVLIEVRK